MYRWKYSKKFSQRCFEFLYEDRNPISKLEYSFISCKNIRENFELFGKFPQLTHMSKQMFIQIVNVNATDKPQWRS